jgi:hypothetical protein
MSESQEIKSYCTSRDSVESVEPKSHPLNFHLNFE